MKRKTTVKRVRIGTVGVDSGKVMVVDPCYVLKDNSEVSKYLEEHDLKKAFDQGQTDYETACDVSYTVNPFRPTEVHNPQQEMTDEQHRKIAYGAVCSTGGIGDGGFPVFAVYEGDELVGMEVRFDQ
jgi:hypothetical protein